MFCLKCGIELKKKGKILACPKCKTAYTAEVVDGEETLTEYIEPRGLSSKNHIIIVLLGAVLAVIIAIVGITVGVSVSRSQSVARGFEIAEHYLSDLNYERAVIKFQNILEIEPMNVEAYLGLAEAYVGMGKTNKAIKVLKEGYELTGDEQLQDMIDELERADEPPVSSGASSSGSETSEPEATTLLNLEDENFRIVNGVLKKYLGKGGDVVIPDGVITIGESAFYWCSSLTSVTIGNSVTTIGDYAFGDAFRYTPWLKNQTDEFVIVGDGVLLDYNGNGGDVVIPSNVKYVSSAFSGCESLTSVTIPDSVTTIGSNAFSSCDSLTSINVSKSNKSYVDVDGIVFSKDKTELIAYPAGKTAVSYTIPNSVTTIGGYAFAYCSSLTSVVIPDSVTTIGNDAFYKCTSLTSATYKGVTYSYENIKDFYKAIKGN